MKKIILALAFLIGTVASAAAACTSPATMHDFPGATFLMSLATVPDGNCGSNVAIPTWAGGTLGAMANYGTSPGAVLVPGMNAFITNTPAVTQSGTWTVQPGNTANTTPWLFNLTQIASTTLGTPTAYGTPPTGNWPGVNAFVTNSNANGRNTAANSSPVVQPSAPSQWHLIAAATTNATSVKASAAVLFSCQLSGIGSTPAYLKIYNKASAPTVGSDTPVKTLIIPAAATAANGAGSNIQFGPGGMALGTGFAAAVTGGITDADATAVAATTFAINCDYE